MLTNVYIDGFNLYYRALKGSAFKWLNLQTLAENLFPNDQINQVCYFTARIVARHNDPSQPQRQQAYLRALSTLPNIQIHFGDFRTRTKRRPLVRAVKGLPPTVEIRDSEEKGTDVNLATRLLVDGFNQTYQQAIIVSNDADFASPMKYVRDDLRLRVALVNPDVKTPSPRSLVNAATYIRQLRQTHLRKSQFPDRILDAHGVISKPGPW